MCSGQTQKTAFAGPHSAGTREPRVAKTRDLGDRRCGRSEGTMKLMNVFAVRSALAVAAASLLVACGSKTEATDAATPATPAAATTAPAPGEDAAAPAAVADAAPAAAAEVAPAPAPVAAVAAENAAPGAAPVTELDIKPFETMFGYQETLIGIIEANKMDLDQAAAAVTKWVSENKPAIVATMAAAQQVSVAFQANPEKAKTLMAGFEEKGKALQARMEKLSQENPKINDHEGLKNAMMSAMSPQ